VKISIFGFKICFLAPLLPISPLWWNPGYAPHCQALMCVVRVTVLKISKNFLGLGNIRQWDFSRYTVYGGLRVDANRLVRMCRI
jgi:hypothetical protein